MKVITLIFFMAISMTLFSQNTAQGLPKEIVEAEGITIPVYDFEGFKPMLELKDETTHVINFWATWCRPCVEEMPHFINLAEELEDQPVEFIFVSLDFRKNLEKGVINFVREHGMENRTAMLNDPDANSWINQVDPSWTGAIPATLITKGHKREFYEKQLTYEELKTITKSFLNYKP